MTTDWVVAGCAMVLRGRRTNNREKKAAAPATRTTEVKPFWTLVRRPSGVTRSHAAPEDPRDLKAKRNALGHRRGRPRTSLALLPQGPSRSWSRWRQTLVRKTTENGPNHGRIVATPKFVIVDRILRAHKRKKYNDERWT